VNEEQLTKALATLAEQFEKFSEKFLVSIETRQHDFHDEPARWYTPKGMTLRFLRIGVGISSTPEVKAVCSIAHGAITCLGFSGTLNLVLELRKKHGKGKGKQAKNSVPGV
jgi:hypothetical protein